MNWAEVDRLVSQDQYQAAADVVAKLLAAAREAGDEAEWTRALTKEVQLRTALHGYETAVRFLSEEPWPSSPRYRLVLELVYAHALTTYVNAYSWEIRQRERVISTDEVDLKKWTLDQLAAEAQRAFLEVWNVRDEWGGESLGDLAEYFEPGDYPAHVRGTLRDTVTYLWVAFLADTSLWRPEHSNEIYRLDLEDLLAGEGAPPDLADPGVHPLVKIGAALRDLEDWHGRNGRPEAAFEARLELLRRLSASFTQEDDRAAIRGHLRERLDELGRHYPWWSVGMAALADFIRQEDAPDALVEARSIALEGERAHPESIGGRRCRAIVAAIEQASYDVGAMASDNFGRRSIQVLHQNLSELHFRAYALDLGEWVSGADDRRLLPSYQDVPRILARRRPAAEWTVELPATPDYRTHATYVTPPLDRPSLYLIAASARRDFAEAFNRRTALSLILGDLVLLRGDQESAALRVVSGETGAGASGVEVDLYRYDWRRGHAKVEEAVSGEDGEVRFDMELSRRQRYFVIARRGGHVALLEGLYERYRGEREESVRSLIYTDRSIYRPGQKVLWKVVAYRQKKEPGSFEVFPGAELTVSLVDANGQEAGTLKATANEFGSASGEFEIPAGRLLGQWQVRAQLEAPRRRLDQAGIKVEEYKRPTFEVEIEEAGDELRLNRPATLHGTVRYYFGMPVTAGDVAWRVVRTPVWRWHRWFGPGIVPDQAPQTLAAGAAELGPDGGFEITFTPEADERLAGSGVTYSYRLEADVTDPGGETRSASRSFRLGFVAVEASIEDPPGFFRGGEDSGTLAVARRDLDGNPRPGSARWRLLSLDQPERTPLPADLPAEAPPSVAAEAAAPEDERYRTPGDLLRPRWAFGGYTPEAVLRLWDDGAELGGGELRHAEDGVARIDLPELAPGAYRIRYSTEDDFGAAFELAYEFVVVEGESTPGESTPLKLPGLLAAERTTVAVGEVARFAVHSGLPGQEMELAVYRGGEVERRKLVAGGGVQVVELPVGRDDRGGFGVKLTLVADHQLVRLSESISVPWSDRELELEFATFRDKMRPGESETWTIRVKGGDAEALAAGTAELLAYMYDKSLDLFAVHTPPDVLSVYPRFGQVPPSLQSSLGASQAVWQSTEDFSPVPSSPRLTADRLKVLDGYGIGGPGRRFRLGSRRMLKSVGMSPPAPQAAPIAMADAPAEQEEALAADLGASARAPEPEPPAAAADVLRTDFSETAFWEPHLLIGDGGTAELEFTVPDSLTEWNVWVHAVTKDLRYGRLERQVKTAKELMVRPYLPRFLREGDRAELRVVVSNAGDAELRGSLDFEVRDPETDESLAEAFGLDAASAAGVEFAAPAGGSAELSFPIRAPSRLGTVAFVAHASAGDLSDGELRPLPVLPSRVHLAQSRFATLRDRDREVLAFEDLARDDDPTRIHDQLVVTLDAQLFYGVLGALPYLVEYPYDCTEQILNRFLSTGILSTLYDDYPAVGRMAARLAERETRYEAWDEDDPNRKMLLEETPWLTVSRGGETPEEGLVNVLDPEIARATREVAIAKLREAQTSSGGFPWWPGGPPSPYMTLYIVDGLSRAVERGVDVPRDLVVKAWSYLHRYYVDEVVREMMKDDCCWEVVTYLNYVLSNYADGDSGEWTGGLFTGDDRKTMLEFSLRHWRRHSPRLKCYLALTLHRAQRGDEARQIFAGVMDSAKTTDGEGTFWAPEDRAWLWYNDTIESHAFALRTLLELAPDDGRRHGLVQWLYLNKHLGHWKSTRATAEVIYSLVHYLEAEGTLGVREEASVTLGGETRTFTFEPDRYTGKDNRIVIAGDEVDRGLAEIEVEKQTPGFLFASATWHFSTEELPEEARGDFFAVTRRYFRRVHDGREWVLEPLEEGAALTPGDQVEVHLSLRTKHAAEYVHLRDPRGAGFEPESLTSGYRWDLGIGWYEEVRDSGANFFFDWLPVGEYTFKYRLRANVAGTFRVGPATVQSMYAPEFVGYSSGVVLRIVP